MDMPEKLYKYEPFNAQSLSNLKNQQIYFSKPKRFNDPFDCSIRCEFDDITSNDLVLIHKHYLNICPDKAQYILKYGEFPNKEFSVFIKKITDSIFNTAQERFLNQRGISCFSEKRDEILMWSHYADSHKGFCLEFDTKYPLFDKAFKVDYSAVFPKIDQVGLLLDDDLDQILKMFSTKYINWEYEEEWRSIYEEPDTLLGYDGSALTGVYFGAEMDSTHKEIIALILQGQNLNVKFYEGKKSNSRFIVDFISVNYTSHLKSIEKNSSS